MGLEYTCLACRHGFPWFYIDGPSPSCPRCGSVQVERNPWLLSRPDTAGLEDDDHFLANLLV